MDAPAPAPSRWTWPPKDAALLQFRLVEEVDAAGREGRRLAPGEVPERLHLRALQWLLAEHPRTEAPTGRATTVTIDIARTEMAGGRVGHRYALDGKPVGAVGLDAVRGAVWRWLRDLLGGNG
jgi:hypothetical protein